MYHSTVQKIISLLQSHNVWYETFQHPPVTTSEEASKLRTGYTLSQGAKALIVKIDQGHHSGFVELVLPADKQLDNKLVKQNLPCKSFRFATLEEVSALTGGVERGGVPPFGNLFNLDVYVDPSLFAQEKIVFNAGDRSFSIGMLSRDYKHILSPKVVSLTT